LSSQRASATTLLLVAGSLIALFLAFSGRLYFFSVGDLFSRGSLCRGDIEIR
jgi:hypothetical protein